MKRAVALSTAILAACATYACAPIDVELAEAEAVRRFSDYTEAFQVDPSAFDGPLPAEAPKGALYGFEWKYIDNEDRVSFFVWIDSDGTSHAAIDGDMERLKARRRI